MVKCNRVVIKNYLLIKVRYNIKLFENRNSFLCFSKPWHALTHYLYEFKHLIHKFQHFIIFQSTYLKIIKVQPYSYYITIIEAKTTINHCIGIQTLFQQQIAVLLPPTIYNRLTGNELKFDD